MNTLQHATPLRCSFRRAWVCYGFSVSTWHTLPSSNKVTSPSLKRAWRHHARSCLPVISDCDTWQLMTGPSQPRKLGATFCPFRSSVSDPSRTDGLLTFLPRDALVPVSRFCGILSPRVKSIRVTLFHSSGKTIHVHSVINELSDSFLGFAAMHRDWTLTVGSGNCLSIPAVHFEHAYYYKNGHLAIFRFLRFQQSFKLSSFQDSWYSQKLSKCSYLPFFALPVLRLSSPITQVISFQ